DGREVERTEEPRVAAHGRPEEPVIAPPTALLDALLPRRRQLPAEGARGVDDVDLAPGQARPRLGDLRRARGGEDLVAHDHRPAAASDLAGQRVPVALRVAGGTAPVLAEQ